MGTSLTELTFLSHAVMRWESWQIPREARSVSGQEAAIASSPVALPREVAVAKSRRRLGACPTAGCRPPEPEIGPPSS